MEYDVSTVFYLVSCQVLIQRQQEKMIKQQINRRN